MPNRLISVNYNNHTCFIHLYFDENKMDVNLLDQQLREELRTSSFSINSRGELITNEWNDAEINTPAIQAFYTVILQQQKEAINSFTSLIP